MQSIQALSPQCQCVYQPGSSTEFWYLGFLLGFHYVGMIDWCIGHRTELHLQFPFLPGRMSWLKAPTLLLHGWSFCWWAPNPESGVIEGLVNNKGTPAVLSDSVQSVHSLSRVRLFATPWTTAHQASLSITNSRSLFKLVHQVGDAMQPSHPLLSPSPPAPNPSVTQSYPILCDPMDYSLPGSSVDGIFRARILEWVAISSSRRDTPV